MRVIVVEPDDGVRATMAEVLSDRAHFVEQPLPAESLADAVRRTDAELVIVGGGVDRIVTETLRIREATGPEGPFVLGAITYRVGVDPSAMVDASVDDYFLLPLDPQRFSARVRVAERAIATRDRRRRAERALRNERDFNDTVLDAAGCLVLVLDREARVQRFNRTCEEVSGFRREEVLGIVALPRLLLPDEAPAVARVWTRLLEGEARVDHENHWVARDGSRRLVAWKNVAIRDAQDRVSHVIATGLDVTEREKLRAQLQLSDRMASIGTLAAGVAHEINNPLAYVTSNLELLERSVNTAADQTLPLADVRSAVADARSGVERVREIVRSLRLFSRGDDAQRSSVSLRRVLEASISIAQSVMSRRGRVETEFAGTPPVFASESQLGQVFLNLLVNASQAVRDDGGEGRDIIRVRLGHDPERRRAWVEISDSGVGIPKENLSRIFDPFYSTKPVGEGTGLGLAIVHGIVRSLNGSITVASEEGVGTTFRVELPTMARDRLTPPPQPRTSAPAILGRMRVLLIDDEPNLRGALAQILSFDHEVTTADGGKQALKILRDGKRFDAILCDLMMPDLDGIAVVETMRKEMPDLAERVVVLTGGAYTARAKAFLAEESVLRLDKPFGIEELREVLRKVERSDSHVP